jgi:ATP-dependent DNA helicase 2 subunit 2
VYKQLFAESKDEVSLILLGTEGTANELHSSEDPTAYCNITVARPLGPVDWDLLKYIENDLKPGNTPADCILKIVFQEYFEMGISSA